jgi:pimeloyl-ACP methyl ester carboxylesterase
MAIKPDNQVSLWDGRRLGYAEYGDPDGKPVLHFHGFPSSRHEGCFAASDEIATRLHARVLVVERPGFGLSDFQAGRRIVDWVEDVQEFADALYIESFALLGFSGGGPYVAACAWKIPQRIRRAGIISGTRPLNKPGALRGMDPIDRLSLVLARRAPGLLGLVYRWLARGIQHNPVGFFSQYARALSANDKTVLAQPDVQDMFKNALVEAFRTGANGVIWDSVLITRPWGFSLQDISMPISLWQGEADNVVPPSHGRYLCEALPNCQSRFYPDEGHVSMLINLFDEILSTLVGR